MFSSSSDPGTSPMPIRGRIELDVVLESEIKGNKKNCACIIQCLQPQPYLYGCRPRDKSAYLKIIFLISQPKHMFWVLKRTVSMRRFF